MLIPGVKMHSGLVLLRRLLFAKASKSCRQIRDHLSVVCSAFLLQGCPKSAVRQDVSPIPCPARGQVEVHHSIAAHGKHSSVYSDNLKVWPFDELVFLCSISNAFVRTLPGSHDLFILNVPIRHSLCSYSLTGTAAQGIGFGPFHQGEHLLSMPRGNTKKCGVDKLSVPLRYNDSPGKGTAA